MCFSLTASIVGGVGLSVIGVATLRHTKNRAEIPFAAIPLVFGIQQLVEGFVWFSLGSSTFCGPETALQINSLATFAYSMFSHALWPILVPIAVLLLEQKESRKHILRVMAVFGVFVGLYMCWLIASTSVSSRIVEQSIAYIFDRRVYNTHWAMAYMFVTVGSTLMSSHKMVKWFGVVLFATSIIAWSIYHFAFFSVWCFFSAIASVMVALYFRKRSNSLRSFLLPQGRR